MTNLKVFDMVRFDKTVTFVTVSKRAAYDIIFNGRIQVFIGCYKEVSSGFDRTKSKDMAVDHKYACDSIYCCGAVGI